MASITLQIVVGNLSNSDLDGYKKRFNNWVADRAPLPDVGVLDEVSEIDREEDERDEEE